MSKRLLCINAEPKSKFIDNGIVPLTEGRVYEVRGEGVFPKGYGYYLKGIYNPEVNDAPIEVSYAASRFVELSEAEIDGEVEMAYWANRINEHEEV